MPIIRFKLCRIKEWFVVLKLAGASAIPAIIMTLLTAKPVGKRTWRTRMRRCMRCPVYDRMLRRCWASDGDREWGCKCYMPFKALFAEHGWMAETNNPQADKFCW